MAISFARISFPRLLPHSGACRILAYNARCPVNDLRLGMTFDYSDQAKELVEEFTIAPDGVVPPETVEAFANIVDAAEAQHVRKSLKNRKRRPQVGAAIVMALPPKSELTPDEALEIPRRAVEHVRDGRNLLSHTALHDPALVVPGARTRHVHIMMPLREWQGDAFGGPKLRELFARVRHRAEPKARPSFVAEGVDWPRLVWEVQQTLFTECAIDLVVDPIAPHSEPHWDPRSYRDGEARVLDRRAHVRALNLEAIRGDAADLLESLMRGRSSLTVAELERFIEGYIDTDDDRRGRLDAVLGDDGIAGLTAEAGEAARFVTTREILDQLIGAATLVDRAARETNAPRIRAVTAADHDGVAAAIHDLLRTNPRDRGRRRTTPLFLGLRRSDAERVARVAGFAHPTIASIGAALEARPKRKGRHRLPAGGIVVVPRAEQVGDQLLARLLLACDAKHVTVVLGHDQSRKKGIVANRLAAYAAETLSAIPAPARPGFPDQAETARALRAGLIGPAVKTMAPMLTFAPVDAAAAERDAADFVVCDDPGRLAETNERLADTRTSIEVTTRRRKHVLHEGEWIAFTETDYAVRPPRIRAGRLAQIVSIERALNEIHVALPDGTAERIDLEAFPHVRAAYAISIREARHISWPAGLHIEITTPRHAWAALLLACSGADWPSVVVDPKVACDVAELTAVVRANLPGALPGDLSIAPRPEAIHGLPPEAADDRADFVGFEIESIPEFVSTAPPLADADGAAIAGAEPEITPAAIGPSKKYRAAGPARELLYSRAEKLTQLAGVDPELRRRIASSCDGFGGFLQLRRCLAADNPEREATADRLLSLCDADGPTAAVIASLMGRARDAGPARERPRDFPMEMEVQAPRAWSDWDLFRVKFDLATMLYPSRWEIVKWPETAPEPAPEDDPQWMPPQP